MIPLLFYTVAAFGLAFCLGYAKITLGIRLWLAQRESRVAHWFVLLLECPACLGFWIGLISALFLWVWILDEHRVPLILFMITSAFYTCGSNFIIGRATGLIRDDPEEET